MDKYENPFISLDLCKFNIWGNLLVNEKRTLLTESPFDNK